MNNALRFQVLERDGFRCQYCGAAAPDVRLEVDHVNPRANGGTDALENLKTACYACNRGKRSVPPRGTQLALRNVATPLKRTAWFRLLDENWRTIRRFGEGLGLSFPQATRLLLKRGLTAMATMTPEEIRAAELRSREVWASALTTANPQQEAPEPPSRERRE